MKVSKQSILIGLMIASIALHVVFKIKNHDQYNNLKDAFSYEQMDKPLMSMEGWENHEVQMLTQEQLQERIDTKPLTVLSFWETWCEPCEREMPMLQEISDTYPWVNVVGVVTTSSMDKIQMFAFEHDIVFSQYRDEDETYHEQYNILGYPSLVVLDTNMNVLHQSRGFRIYEDGTSTLDPVIDVIEDFEGGAL